MYYTDHGKASEQQLVMNGPNTSSDDSGMPSDSGLAADLVRKKLARLYASEPAVKQEISSAVSARHRSKHQQFLYNLSQSGQSLADVQTAWHNYYISLPDQDKHDIWREFYDAYGQHVGGLSGSPAAVSTPQAVRRQHPLIKAAANTPAGRTAYELKKHILGNAERQQRRKQHRKSAVFGVSAGTLAAIVVMFGFFNERFIAPFIAPSKVISSTQIIIDPSSTTDPSGLSKVVIPKINVEVPVVYNQNSIEEDAIQQSLQDGVVHYAGSPYPGEKGNAVIVGHSSNNILNKGKYKFAFVLLSRLEVGDSFILTRDGKRFVYKVYEKRVVNADDVSVMGKTAKDASVTLITCDPPGTSLRRLVVFGEQIAPNPTDNIASHVDPASAQPASLPGNAPSLWKRLTGWITS